MSISLSSVIREEKLIVNHTGEKALELCLSHIAMCHTEHLKRSWSKLRCASVKYTEDFKILVCVEKKNIKASY